MKGRYAVIGFPIGHTMSPFIHKALFSLSNMDISYDVLEIAPEELEDKIPLLKGYDGFNITIPHKQSILPFLSYMHQSAKLYNAVNTVSTKDGEMTGYSTDAEGFCGALALNGISLSGKVLICGNGGVARTLAIHAAKKGCQVTLAVRNILSENALAIKKECFDLFSADVSIMHLSDVSGGFDIIVNGTPLGMYPNFNGSALEKEQLTGAKFVFDTVYNPKETLLIKYAKELNIPCDSGMAMLVMQAAKAHEHWYGGKFELSDLKKIIQDANEEMERLFCQSAKSPPVLQNENGKNIILCGFMGSGKTTVGKELAALLNKEFLDLDHFIEEKENLSVSEMFSQKGEPYFRATETKAAKEVGKMQNLVIAVGGGTVLNPENTKYLKENGVLVYLKVDANTVIKRLETDDTRPLLKNDKNAAVLNLLEKRSPIYEAAADLTANGNKSAKEVVNQIINFENIY
jgi:shikimate dehydrogenase